MSAHARPDAQALVEATRASIEAEWTAIREGLAKDGAPMGTTFAQTVYVGDTRKHPPCSICARTHEWIERHAEIYECAHVDCPKRSRLTASERASR